MTEADNPRQIAIRAINAALEAAGRPPLAAPHSILTPDLEGIVAALEPPVIGMFEWWTP